MSSGACPPQYTQHSRQLSFGPNFSFIHIRKIALGGAVPDYPVQIAPLPVGDENEWTIMFLACDPVHTNDTLNFHFKPLNKSYPGGNAVTTDGSEEWFEFNNWLTPGGNPVGIKQPGNSFTFEGPMPPTLYFDIGQEAGGTDYNITLVIGPGVKRFFGR